MINFLAAKVKAAALGVTDVELKVLEARRLAVARSNRSHGTGSQLSDLAHAQATNEQAWGPHGAAMVGTVGN